MLITGKKKGEFLHFKAKRVISVLVFMVLIIFVYNKLVNNDLVSSKLFLYTTERMFEIFKDSSTLEELNKANAMIPSIQWHTLLGTGVTRGITNDGLLIWHDSGYVKRYTSIGLIMAIVTYINYLMYNVYIIKDVDRAKKRYIMLCLIVLMVIEYKEPFIYMLAYPFILICVGMIEKNEK